MPRLIMIHRVRIFYNQRFISDLTHESLCVRFWLHETVIRGVMHAWSDLGEHHSGYVRISTATGRTKARFGTETMTIH